MALSNTSSPIGIFSCTLTQSPVVRWILPAQIRTGVLRDLAFIGNEFVTVKQVAEDDQLVDIAHKNDFDSQIRAAAVLHIGGHDSHKVDESVKIEGHSGEDADERNPQDILVLTLASSKLVFLYLTLDELSQWTFQHSILPLPGFGKTSQQPGEYIAIDPLSRALAVAAYMEEVVLYSLKPRHVIQTEIQHKHDNWCPVLERQLARVDGNIDKLAFLHPTAGDQEQILLLLLTVDEKAVKAVLIDWHTLHGLHLKQIHAGQALYAEPELPSILVPIADSAFLLCVGTQITCWTKLISGSAVGHILDHIQEAPIYPGSSSRLPLWCNWSRPCRKIKLEEKGEELYLLREDGLLVSVHVQGPSSIRMLPSEHLGLHHGGTSFATLEIDAGLDLVIVGGEMSNGKVSYVERLLSLRQEEDREDAHLGSETTAIISNWASVVDVIRGDHQSAPRGSVNHTQSLFVTSGRQPYGAITELRPGIEARLTAFASIENLRSFTAMWTHTDIAGNVLVLLSGPASTRIIAISMQGDLEELDGAGLFDTECRTVAIYSTAHAQLIQITTRKLILSNGTDQTILGSHSQVTEAQEFICAALVAPASVLVTVERNDNILQLRHRYFDAQGWQPSPPQEVNLDNEVICIEAFVLAEQLVVCLSMLDGGITIFTYNSRDCAPVVYQRILPFMEGGISLCDSIMALERPGRILLACGLRNGKIVTFSVDLSKLEPLHLEQTLDLGHSAVKLSRLSCGAAIACAISGNSIYMCRPDQRGPEWLAAEPVWITDKSRPELAQGDVIVCAQIPRSSDPSPHAYSGALLLLSGDDLLITTSAGATTTVPRQILLSGSPHRLLYANSHRCLIAASYHAEASQVTSTQVILREQCTRQIWPKLEFISRRTTRPSFTYDMQPGERVNAMLEWSYRDNDDRLYSHLLVGGSYVRRTGERRGRVWFLKPTIRDWVVRGAGKVFHHSFPEEVYALAMYDPVTYVALAGDKVYLKRFASATRSWDEVCKPFSLASRGVFLTVEENLPSGPLITVSTALDSIIMLQLRMSGSELGEQHLELDAVAVAPQAESLLSHLVLPPTLSVDQGRRTALISTRYGKLVGLDCIISSPFRNGRVLFEAYLPRSMTRMIPMPPANQSDWPLPEILSERIAACSADGTITNCVLLSSTLWRPLFWLQRLVEWSETLSPFSWTSPIYRVGEVGEGMHTGRLLPIGFAQSTDEALLRTGVSRANDMHLDGDILGRALQRNGKQAIQEVLERLSISDSTVGSWVRPRMSSELDELDVLLVTLRSLLDGTKSVSRI